MTADLVEFLRTRLNEDEQAAKDLANASRMIGAKPDFYGAGGPAAATYWRHFNEARSLAEANAKRRIIELHHPSQYGECVICSPDSCGCAGGDPDYPCETLRLIALQYRNHPDYRPEWAPED